MVVFPFPNKPTRWAFVWCLASLLADAQLCDDGAVTLDVLLGQVVQQSAALADHLVHAQTAVVVVGMSFQVGGELIDALGQDGDLDFGEPVSPPWHSFRLWSCRAFLALESMSAIRAQFQILKPPDGSAVCFGMKKLTGIILNYPGQLTFIPFSGRANCVSFGCSSFSKQNPLRWAFVCVWHPYLRMPSFAMMAR